MLSLAVGFIMFAFLHEKTPTFFSRKIMLSVVSLVSAFALFGFVLVKNPIIFLLFSVTHMLATGVIGGAVHYYAAMALRDQTYSGRVIGSAIGIAAFLQVLLLMSVSSSLLKAFLLVWVLAAVIYLILWKTPIAIAIQKPPQTPPVNCPAKSYLYYIMAIVAVISLMGGFNDGIITTMHTQQTVDMYSYPRLLYLGGVVMAGFIADIHARRYLPVVMLSVMMCSSVGVMFLNNPLTYYINVCIFFLFAGFAIMYLTVTFFDIAPLTDNPMLWAGMGRTVRFVFIAIGAVSSNFIFSTLSFDSIIAVYILLSVVLLVLFYLSGSLTINKQTTTISGHTKTEMMNRSTSFALTKRESEVLSYLINNTQTKEIAESLNITERTVKFHITNILSKTGAKNRMDLLIILSKNDELLTCKLKELFKRF